MFTNKSKQSAAGQAGSAGSGASTPTIDNSRSPTPPRGSTNIMIADSASSNSSDGKTRILTPPESESRTISGDNSASGSQRSSPNPNATQLPEPNSLDNSRSPTPEVKPEPPRRSAPRDPKSPIVVYLLYDGKHRIPIQSTAGTGVSYQMLVAEANRQFGAKDWKTFVRAGVNGRRVVGGDVLHEDGVEVEVFDPVFGG